MREGLVYKREKLSGRIIEDNDGYYEFKYEPEYIKRETEAVSVTLPIREAPYRSDRLFGFFDGLIPEGWLLNIITHNFEIKARDRMGLLLATGRDTVGSVSVVPTKDDLVLKPRMDRPSIEKDKIRGQTKFKQVQQNIDRSLCLICTQPLKNTKANYHLQCSKNLFGTGPEKLIMDLELSSIEAMAIQNINQHLALTGAQSKISISLTPSDGAYRVTVASGQYILKPPPAKYPDFPMVEHASMLISKNLGLDTAHMGLIPFPSGQYGYITKRFDREVSSDCETGFRKLSFEDFGQIFHRNIEAEKYRGSYNQIGKWLQMNARIPGESAVRFFTQVFLSYLIGNNDFHLKNIAVLTDNGITLSPVYDLVSTQLIDSEPEIDLTLQLNGRDRKLRRKDWLLFGEDMGLKDKAVVAILSRFKQSLPIICTTIDNSFLSIEKKYNLKNLIIERMDRAQI